MDRYEILRQQWLLMSSDWETVAAVVQYGQPSPDLPDWQQADIRDQQLALLMNIAKEGRNEKQQEALSHVGETPPEQIYTDIKPMTLAEFQASRTGTEAAAQATPAGPPAAAKLAVSVTLEDTGLFAEFGTHLRFVKYVNTEKTGGAPMDPALRPHVHRARRTLTEFILHNATREERFSTAELLEKIESAPTADKKFLMAKVRAWWTRSLHTAGRPIICTTQRGNAYVNTSLAITIVEPEPESEATAAANAAA